VEFRWFFDVQPTGLPEGARSPHILWLLLSALLLWPLLVLLLLSEREVVLCLPTFWLLEREVARDTLVVEKERFGSSPSRHPPCNAMQQSNRTYKPDFQRHEAIQESNTKYQANTKLNYGRTSYLRSMIARQPANTQTKPALDFEINSFRCISDK